MSKLYLQIGRYIDFLSTYNLNELFQLVLISPSALRVNYNYHDLWTTVCQNPGRNNRLFFIVNLLTQNISVPAELVLQRLVSRGDNWCSRAYGTPLVSSPVYCGLNLHNKNQLLCKCLIFSFWHLFHDANTQNNSTQPNSNTEFT